MTEPGQQPGLSTEVGDGLPASLWDDDDFSLADQRSADELSASLVDLSFIGAALRRGRKVWLSIAVLGLVAGIALLVGFKPAYGVSAALLMANDSSIDAFTAMETNSIEAQEPAVTQLADKTLGTPGVKLSYSVVITNNQVLTISVSAPTSDAANKKVIAIADAFLSVHEQVVRNQVTQEQQGQQQQLALDQQSVASLKKQISQVSSEPASTAQQQQLSSLHTRLTAAETLLSQISGTYYSNDANAQLNGAVFISGSRILAITVPTPVHSEKKFVLEYVGGGFFAALVLGLAIVAIRALLSDKLYRRDDVAVALSAPVRLSVVSTAKRKRWLSIRDKAAQRKSDVARVAEYLRSGVPVSSGGPASLAIVAVDELGLVVAAVSRLASLYARRGMRVCVADLAGGALAGSLGVTSHGVRPVDVEGARVLVVLPDASDVAPIGPDGRVSPSRSSTVSSDIAAVYSASDVFVTLAMLDPAVGADHLVTWSGEVVAVVTAGQSSVTRVQAVGEMVRDAGAHLASCVLLGADSTDESFGLVKA